MHDLNVDCGPVSESRGRLGKTEGSVGVGGVGASGTECSALLGRHCWNRQRQTKKQRWEQKAADKQTVWQKKKKKTAQKKCCVFLCPPPTHTPHSVPVLLYHCCLDSLASTAAAPLTFSADWDLQGGWGGWTGTSYYFWGAVGGNDLVLHIVTDVYDPMVELTVKWFTSKQKLKKSWLSFYTHDLLDYCTQMHY